MSSENQIDATATIGADCTVGRSVLKPYSRLKANVEFRDSVLGEYSYVSSFSVVNKTVIGKFTSIAHGCFIGLWEHDTFVSTHSFYLYETSGGFVKGYTNYTNDHVGTMAGSDVWIGANAVIRKGVTVGDGAIIGASAVVTKDVLPYEIVVGNPARSLKFRYDETDRQLLLRLRWWDLPRVEIQKMVDLGLFFDFGKFKHYVLDQGLDRRSA